jgi:glycosyltransferase involved in cell wall biosynthesis
MNYLFIHQSMPSQFIHLAPALASAGGNRVVFLTRTANVDLPGVERVSYQPMRAARPETHHYVRLYENCVLHGQQVLRECRKLLEGGFRPDVIVAHPGWGEALFLKDILPHTPLLNYCEFYYHGRGHDVGFSPDQPAGLDAICRARARNAHLLLSLESCDRGLSPTHWQRDSHPAALRGKIAVIFDGIDTARVRPAADARFALPDGRVLTAADTVVTYVARNFEPYRGFPSFMRAVPEILRRCPEAHVVIAGGDGVSYGREPPGGGTWREAMQAEVGPLDPARVHMLGRLPYAAYLALLQVSTAHVYLTVPFVLSWSCLEAMAAGCVVVGSRTPPVEEVIQDGDNGLLADFHDPAGIAARVAEAVDGRDALHGLRARARRTIESRYALAHCLPAQMRLLRELA